MTSPSDPEIVRELRNRAAVGVPTMSLDEAAVRAAGRRRLSSRRWVAGAGAAAAVALAVVVTTTGLLHPPEGIGPAGATSPAPCMTPPTVEYTAPGKAVMSLPLGATVTVTAPVGEPVTIRFRGDCAAGGRLSINGAGPGETNGYTDLWTGQITGSWTPTESGTRTLSADWSCTGPIPCPLGALGSIRVITEQSHTTPTS